MLSCRKDQARAAILTADADAVVTRTIIMFRVDQTSERPRMLCSLDVLTADIYPGYINVSMKTLGGKFPPAAFTSAGFFFGDSLSSLTSAPGLILSAPL